MKDLHIERWMCLLSARRKPPFLALDMPCSLYRNVFGSPHARVVGVAGAVSYADHGYESSVAETLRSMIATLIGRSPWTAKPSSFDELEDLVRAPQAQSIVDIALWICG